jgi:membrane protease YdiL (CAAX protease family)
MNLIKSACSDLWEFLKHPVDKKDTKLKDSYRLRQLAVLLFLDLLSMLILISIISLIENAGIIDMSSHKAIELLKNNPFLAIIAGVIMAPIFEEFIFRTFIVERYSPFKLLAFVIARLNIYQEEKINKKISNLWHKNYKVVIYMSALIFGYVHITNYDINLNILIFSPLIIAPQFVIGLFLAYFRVRFGLIWAMLFHALHNLVLMLPVIFTLQ